MKVLCFRDLLTLLIKTNGPGITYLTNNLVNYTCVIMFSLWSNHIKLIKEQQCWGCCCSCKHVTYLLSKPTNPIQIVTFVWCSKASTFPLGCILMFPMELPFTLSSNPYINAHPYVNIPNLHVTTERRGQEISPLAQKCQCTCLA
jgi:hypothetical protein